MDDSRRCTTKGPSGDDHYGPVRTATDDNSNGHSGETGLTGDGAGRLAPAPSQGQRVSPVWSGCVPVPRTGPRAFRPHPFATQHDVCAPAPCAAAVARLSAAAALALSPTTADGQPPLTDG